MKYTHHILYLAFLLAGCDAVGSPIATITGVDVAVADVDEFVEIQDVSGRSYARIEDFPADVDVQLFSEGRDYFIVLLSISNGDTAFVAASESFKAGDLTGSSFTTSGDVEAILTLE